MALKQTVIYHCDLCGKDQQVAPALAGEPQFAQLGYAEIASGAKEKRLRVKMDLCDECYRLFARIVSELSTNLKNRRKPQ